MQNLRRKNIIKRQLVHQKSELNSIEESKEENGSSNSEKKPMDDSLIFESLDGSRDAVFAK
jgi:hypothetical protein